jgi:hypothetical protein
MFRTGLNTSKALSIGVALWLLATAAPASAQGGIAAWIERGYFNINLGFETTSGTLNDSTTFTIYEETGALTMEQNVDSGSFFDFSVGGRVWRNVSVGVGYHRGGNTSEASGAASVPHPTRFDANRTVALAAGDLDRTEQAFHIQIGYMFPITEEISVHATIGPSFFNLNQDVLAGATYAEVGPPYSTVNATPIIEERSDSVTGINAGVDVTYKFYTSDAYNIGAGAFLRYAGASARIRVIENEVDSDVGGLQFGLGLRVRF